MITNVRVYGFVARAKSDIIETERLIKIYVWSKENACAYGSGMVDGIGILLRIAYTCAFAANAPSTCCAHCGDTCMHRVGGACSSRRAHAAKICYS